MYLADCILLILYDFLRYINKKTHYYNVMFCVSSVGLFIDCMDIYEMVAKLHLRGSKIICI